VSTHDFQGHIKSGAHLVFFSPLPFLQIMTNLAQHQCFTLQLVEGVEMKTKQISIKKKTQHTHDFFFKIKQLTTGCPSWSVENVSVPSRASDNGDSLPPSTISTTRNTVSTI
jgi:hypothetical protein